jgi:hypothetical protein
MLIRVAVLAIALAALPVTGRAQSCAAADAAIGKSKDRPVFKKVYDKFADTTSLETTEQQYHFKTSEAYFGVSFNVKHAGVSDAPVSTEMHIRGAFWYDHGVPIHPPAIFTDSAVLTILADSAKLTLHSTSHRAPRVLSAVASVEDLYIAFTPDQLAQIVLAKDGGMRLVDQGATYDMQLKGDLKFAASTAYRLSVCAPAFASAGK